MRKIEHRALFCRLILLAFIFGIVLFLVRYVRDSEKWYEQSYNKHLYSDNGELKTGTVTDRNGVILSSVKDGIRGYSPNFDIRVATLHTVGDSAGKIRTGALSNLREYLVAYKRSSGANAINDEGNRVSLTIDAEACSAAYKAMNGLFGCACVYNYKTGEILCLVSSPSYDPNNIPEDIEWSDSYTGAYINRFFSSTFTPGSVFKTLTLQAALSELPDASTRLYECTGSVKIGDNYISCPKAHGTQTLQEAYANSCNCTFAALAAEIGGDKMASYVDKAGLSSSRRIFTFTNAKGSFELASATKYQLGWAGVGLHHDLVNPCSLLMYIGAVANGGKAAVPTFLKNVTASNGTNLKTPETEYTGTLIDAGTAAIMRGYMEYNVSHVYGTDRFPNVRMGAKSGTVEQKTGKSNGWFAGYLNSEEHPYAFVVFLEHGGAGSGAPADVAAAALKALISVP